MSLKLAIWDMDGTLVDSRDVIAQAMDRAFQVCGRPPPGYDRTRHIVGLGLVESCRRLVDGPVSENDLAALVAAYSAAFSSRRQEPDFKEPLYDGALETLEWLQKENWAIAMATGKSRRGIRALFDMHPLERYFDTVHCADDGPGKPDPAMCLAAMKQMGAAPAETLMIGDAVHDIRMGHAAGVKTVAVTWGFATREELAAVAPDHIASSFAELRNYLADFANRAGK